MSIARSSVSMLAKGAGVGSGVGVLGVGAAGAAAVGLAGGEKEASKCVVPEGYMGVRERFKHIPRDKDGNPVPKILSPGLKLQNIPLFFTHSMKLVWVRDRWNSLGNVPFMRNGTVMQAESRIKWKVSEKDLNPYKALYEVQTGSLDDAVADICTNGLRNVLISLENDDDLQNEKLIYDQVNDHCRDELLDYGSSLLGIYLRNVTPAGEEITKSGMREIGEAVSGLLGRLVTLESVPNGKGNGASQHSVQ